MNWALSLIALPLLGILSQDVTVPSMDSILERLPNECTKNGQKYKEGESFEIGRLRYTCRKFGMYSIDGCRTEKNESMKAGEIFVRDNVLHQCLKSGAAVFYRETTCGIMGQPDCDKIPKPSGFEKSQATTTGPPQGREIIGHGLPPGWRVFENGRQPIKGTNISFVSRTLIFSSPDRKIRKSGFGVPVDIEEVEVGTDKPSLPAHVMMKKERETGGERLADHTSSHFTPLYTQNLRTNLEIADSSTHRRQTRQDIGRYKAGTIVGSRSDVLWSGKNININGKSVAAGPGTFTFGNRPTGAFIRKEYDH